MVAMIAEFLEHLRSCLLMIDGAAERLPLFTVLFIAYLNTSICKVMFYLKSKKNCQLFPYPVIILMSQLSSQWIVRAGDVGCFIRRWSNTHSLFGERMRPGRAPGDAWIDWDGTCAGTKRTQEVNPSQFLFIFCTYTSCQNQIWYIVMCCNETNCW